MAQGEAPGAEHEVCMPSGRPSCRSWP